MLNQERSRCPVTATDAAAMYNIKHNRFKSLTDCERRFTAATKVLEHMNGNLEKALVGLTEFTLKDDNNIKRANTSPTQIKKIEERFLKQFLACRFLAGTDMSRFVDVSSTLKMSTFLTVTCYWMT